MKVDLFKKLTQHYIENYLLSRNKKDTFRYNKNEKLRKEDIPHDTVHIIFGDKYNLEIDPFIIPNTVIQMKSLH